MAATIWRISGIQVFGDADLDLSALVLFGAGLRLDAGASIMSSHAPISGSLTALGDDDMQTRCVFAAADVRSPGFFIQWTLPEAKDVWCARAASPAKAGALAFYSMAYWGGNRWLSSEQGQLQFLGANVLSMDRRTIPAFDVSIGWTSLSGLASGNGQFYACGASADGAMLFVGGAGSSAAVLNISRDGGRTWTAAQGVVAGTSGFTGAAATPQADVLMLGGYGSGAQLNISRDGGLTWSQPALGSLGFGVYGCAMSADGLLMVITCPGVGNIYLSRDSGVTWSAPAGPVPGVNGFTSCAVSDDGQRILVSGYGSGSAALSLSTDAGLTWRTVASSHPSWASGFERCSMDSSGRLMIALGAGYAASVVLVSRDGGQTWLTVNGPTVGAQGFSGCAVSPDGSGLWVIGYGSAAAVVSYSADEGRSWTVLSGAVAGSLGFANIAVAGVGDVAVVAGSGAQPTTPSMYRMRDSSYEDRDVRTVVARVHVPLASPTLPQTLVMTSTKTGKLLDVEFGGQGRIYGTVSVKGMPSNTPVRRRVRLHRSKDGYLARETWSKADGTYEFREISTRYEYDVIAWDHELQQYSTVANNQLAEVA